MPLFDVPVKVVTNGSMRVNAATPAEARDLVECIDVIDVDLTYDVTDAAQLDAAVSFLQVEGDGQLVEEDDK